MTIMSPNQFLFETLSPALMKHYKKCVKEGKMVEKYLPHLEHVFNPNNTTGDDISINAFIPVSEGCSSIHGLAIKKHGYLLDIPVKVRTGKLENMLDKNPNSSLLKDIVSKEQLTQITETGLYRIEGTNEFYLVSDPERSIEEQLLENGLKFNSSEQYTIEDDKIIIDCEIVKGIIYIKTIDNNEDTQIEEKEEVSSEVIEPVKETQNNNNNRQSRKNKNK